MKREEISKWLKGIVILLGIMALAFLIFFIPALANRCKEIYPEVAFLYWPMLIYVWVIGIGFYWMLILFWNVSCEIGKENSFSKENANSFRWISKIALGVGVLLFIGIVFLGVKYWLDPWCIVVMVVGILANITLSVLAAALSHLILKAYEMKKENELTI